MGHSAQGAEVHQSLADCALSTSFKADHVQPAKTRTRFDAAKANRAILLSTQSTTTVESSQYFGLIHAQRATFMSAPRPQDIWIEQCEAAKDILTKFGLKASFDYLVGEKIMNFAEAAANHPEFSRELPRFIAEVRRMFSAEDMHENLARIEREQAERNAIEPQEDSDAFPEDPGAAERWSTRFELLKDLLTSSQLGTS